MKCVAVAPPLLAALLAAVLGPPAAGVQLRRVSGDRTITQVVKLLQGMLDKSEEEGQADRESYAKYKCYCDDNKNEKAKSIKDLTQQMGLLENEVARLRGDNGALSTESAQLKAQMDATEEARAQAQALREGEEKAFTEEEADLTAAVGQLGKAIEALAAIGADQSLAASAEHANFMAGYGKEQQAAALVKLGASMKQALLAANTFLSRGQQGKVEALLQAAAPFAGTYSAQSGEVVGILKQLEETFESNLASARAAEGAAKEAHARFMLNKQVELDTMKASYDDKQSILGANDGDLSTKMTQLKDAAQQKEDDAEFLASLEGMCATKAEEYEKRIMLRSNEEAAISKAIAILNNDHAFEAFGKVTAASTGATGASLLQLSTARTRGGTATEGAARSAARHVLQEAASRRRSGRLAQIAGLLVLGNPFTKVLDEIEKMQALLAEEGKADKEQLDWCTQERTTSGSSLTSKEGQLTGLNTAITDLENAINNPETGLKKGIADKEATLEDNSKAQRDETETRRAENRQYRESVDNSVQAEGILKEAIAILEKYYSKLAEEAQAEAAFMQEEPAPPTTWEEGSFKGQSEKGGDVIEMLKFILSETQKEEFAAHGTEQVAQHAYEDSMADLKTEERDTQDALGTAKKDLADKKAELETKHEDLEKTEEEKIAIERYLEKIKPGCDFITGNFDTREANRKTENDALEKAVALLKATPAFAAAEAKAKEEDQGECAEKCKSDAAHVDCQACLAKVSVPGYCAGHPMTPGCA